MLNTSLMQVLTNATLWLEFAAQVYQSINMSSNENRTRKCKYVLAAHSICSIFDEFDRKLTHQMVDKITSLAALPCDHFQHIRLLDNIYHYLNQLL